MPPDPTAPLAPSPPAPPKARRHRPPVPYDVRPLRRGTVAPKVSTSVPPAAPAPDHARAPFVDALRPAPGSPPVSFSTPGHKAGAGADPRVRALLGEALFAADRWLPTADFDRTLRAAETLAAAAWGADRAYFSVNGASGGNQALLLATLRPGDEVVIGRDVHQSMLTALILTGARPVWVAPRLHPELGLGLGPAPDDVAAALAAHPAAKLVVLVSPTSWGVAVDLPAVAAVAHARGVPLYVDGAWGPHLGFHPALPPSPLACGADGAVVSPHKLLSGLSQAAVLLTRGARLDERRVAAAAAMTQTTTPLLPILASLDACRRQMALAGEDALGRALELAAGARRRLAALPGIAVADAARLGLPPDRVDPLRLAIDVRGLGLSGVAVERTLRQRFGVAPEMSDRAGIVCLVTAGDSPAGVDRLVAALAALSAERPARRPPPPPAVDGGPFAPGRQAMTPRAAFFAPSRAVPPARAVGEVAAELVVPYPPGIPVLAPGEIVTAEKIAYLREAVALGVPLRAVADPALRTLRVVDPAA